MNNFNNMSEEAKNKVRETNHQIKDKTESLAHQLSEGATKLTEGAANLYQEGVKKIHDFDDSFCEHTEELIKKVQKKPLTSILIAGAVGYLLSHLLKK